MRDGRMPTAEFIIDFVDNYNEEQPFDAKSYNAAMNLVNAFPDNDNFEDIFIKVNFINGSFKTRIGDTMQVAKNIAEILDFDERINQDDISLINDIGRYLSRKNREFNFYSFATKYCHCHKPDTFPIFDNYVKESLEYYRNNFNGMANFKSVRLRNYHSFRETMHNFKVFAQAESINNSIVDRFLWAQSKP